jgi:ComF family protein
MCCSKCGALLGDHGTSEAVFCGRCRELRFDRAVALGIYEGAIASAVIELKRTPFLDERLRHSIEQSDVSRSVYLSSDLIIPVPLSAVRRRDRGFNQAEVIAAHIGSLTGTPVDCFSLVRTRHTPMHRVGMDSRARQLASAKAFSVTRKELIRGRRILLVDDVMTSGATASVCADVLKKSGSSEVNVFTIARAVLM